MTHPTVVPQPNKAVISPRAALISTIRTWFLYRDQAVWLAFVSGAEADDPLREIAVGDEAAANIAEANEARKRAWRIAEQIAQDNEQRVASVMRDAITELLSTEQPRFLLPVSHIPGTF